MKKVWLSAKSFIQWSQWRRKNSRSAMAFLFLLLLCVPFQNCGGGFQPVSESADVASSGGNGNTSGGETPSTETPVTNQDQINRTACSKNFSAPGISVDKAEITFSSGLTAGTGDTSDALMPQITMGSVKNIINSAVESSLQCDRYTTIRVRCVLVDEVGRAPSFSNAVDLLGESVIGKASNIDIARRALDLRDCTNDAFDLNKSPLQYKFGLSFSRDEDADPVRCVQGSVYLRLRVEHVVDATPAVTIGSSTQYVKLNINNGCWTETRLRGNSDTPRLANLGSAVAIDGNWAVTLAPNENMGSVLSAGAAYVFQLVDSQWRFHSKLQLANAQTDDTLTAAAIQGTTMVLSSAYKGGSGQAFVYQYNGSNWVMTQTLTSPVPQANELYGTSLALKGTHLAVGAPHYSRSGSDRAGRVHVYSLSGGAFNYRQTLQHPDVSYANRGFGMSVAIDGTLMAVGAPQAITKESLASGSVVLFTYDGSSWGAPVVKTPPKEQLGLRYGASVALNAGRLLVGAPGTNSGQNLNSGAGHFYPVASGATQNTIALGGQANGMLGTSVAMNSQGVFIGAPYRNNRVGSVCYTAYANVASNRCDYSMLSENATINDGFGWAVGVSGTNVIVGARIKHDPLNTSGASYIYKMK